MIGLKTDVVELLPYTPEWSEEFQKEKQLLFELLSDFSIIVEHVGSTSLIGCPAKPVIDVFVGVESLDIAEKMIPILTSNGYINKFNVPNEIYFKKTANGLTTHHIHIADVHGEVWDSQILFRDYLNSHPDKLHEYIELKTRLALMHPNERDLYSAGKKEFIENCIYETKNECVRKRIKEEY